MPMKRLCRSDLLGIEVLLRIRLGISLQEPGVVPTRAYHQVLWAVVGRDHVDMVNHLIRLEGTSQRGSGYQTML